MKPPATIGKAQPTADFTGAAQILEAKGRCQVKRESVYLYLHIFVCM